MSAAILFFKIVCGVLVFMAVGVAVLVVANSTGGDEDDKDNGNE